VLRSTRRKPFGLVDPVEPFNTERFWQIGT